MALIRLQKERKKLQKRQHPIKNSKRKNSKYSEYHTDKILKCYAQDLTVAQANKKTKRSDKTIYKAYDEFRERFIYGSVQYLELFNGAGALLLLGWPHIRISKAAMNIIQKRHRSFKNVNTELHYFWERLLRIYMQVDMPRTYRYVFERMAHNHYDQHYAEFTLPKGRWTLESIQNAPYFAGNVERLNAIWNVTHPPPKPQIARIEAGGGVVNMPLEPWRPYPTDGLDWNVIFNRSRIFSRSEIAIRLEKDMRWLLRRHPIGQRYTRRSRYWDQYKPDRREIDLFERRYQLERVEVELGISD